jgi:hypothetical protein
VVEAANADEGVSVAVAPDTAIDAATFDEAPAACSVNVDDVNVDASMERLKVTETAVLVETPVAPAAGDWLRITGGVGADAVVIVAPLIVMLPAAVPPVSISICTFVFAPLETVHAFTEGVLEITAALDVHNEPKEVVKSPLVT